jgi:hypothetical protein
MDLNGWRQDIYALEFTGQNNPQIVHGPVITNPFRLQIQPDRNSVIFEIVNLPLNVTEQNGFA